MRPRIVFGVSLALAVAAPAVRAQPEFRLHIDSPFLVDGEPGNDLETGAFVVLGTSGLAVESPGVQGWTLSVASDGCTIVRATTAGTAGAESPEGFRRPGDAGFERTEIVAGGVVSAVVLSLADDATLAPGDALHRLLALGVQSTVPFGGVEDCADCRLRFVDGLEGEGGPVANRVRFSGDEVVPDAEDKAIDFCSTRPFWLRVAGELSTTAAPGAVSASLNPRVRLSADVAGAQGWSFSVESAGDCALTAASTIGGAGADTADGGLRSGGFEKTQLVDPLQNGGRSGAITAIVLSFTLPVELPAGDHVVLGTTVTCDTSAAAEGEVFTHVLSFPPNQDQGGMPPATGPLTGIGQPVKSAVTLDGESVTPGVTDGTLTVRIAFPRIAAFLRCDPNNDERNDLADVVWIVNELFRGGRETACANASDCNDDQRVDLTDAIFAVSYQFGRGPPPPAPFPTCGMDPDATETSCPAGSTRCP
jgi:hypothetical protein